ncbi:hypothetical protein BABA_11046 [Neobacillus bataviensis LMG 21833]|uniref:DUF2194 domain-containing protein n=1 Tax=Neobacillus bataviensis LMG 21833 TaxID=1117379 RepID=K6E7G2_9BACI|nr:DUF2194 domain-containing protein [Neobacillus bataviensis]EKN69246.1 hypothetical protein BABA_11046 [Neobacillus bataviensis LMG 21833]
MGYEFKINKTIMIIIGFLFLFGIVIQLSRSNYVLQLNTGNEPLHNKIIERTSALSAKEVKAFNEDKFLLIYDPEDSESMALKDNNVKTFEYLRKALEVVPVSNIPDDFTEYKNVIIAFSSLEKVSDMNRLTNYVDQGGKVFFEIRPELTDGLFAIYRKLGIYELGHDFEKIKGIQMDSDLLLKGNQLKIEEGFIVNNSLSVQINEACKVYASSLKGLPLLWSTPYGKGTFMVLNGTMLGDKLNRGLIVGSLSYLNEDFIYPIMNSKVVYIDDFPAPFPEGHNDDIYNDYKRNIASFFREIWWPDIAKVAVKDDVKYTGVLIESYNDRVNGPFEDRIGKETLKIFGRELIKSGGEIGIHGYNHQSLTKDQNQVKELGYRAWGSEKDMAESLKEAKKYFDEIFPNYTLRTYVPPSNILSEEGKKAIKEAIPSIDILASLYVDDEAKVSYIQEYEVGKQFIELPRLSSDYHYSDINKWTIASSATMFGSFSHFIHPDDVLDEERNRGDHWNVLSKQFSQMMHDVKKNYPWMSSMTASESAEILKDYSSAQVFISEKNSKLNVYINHFSGNLDFLLRTDKKIKTAKNCDVEKVSEDRYLVHAKANKLVIQLEGK